MTRHLLSLAALTLALAGCSAIDVSGIPTLAGVQGAAVYECGFSPLKKTAEGIIKARQYTSSAAISAAICEVVTKRRSGAVAGIPIEGVTVR